MFKAVTYLPLVLAFLGLASRSEGGGFLGKSPRLWVVIATLAVIQVLIVLFRQRLPKTKGPALVLVLLASLVLFELTGLAVAPYLPIDLVLETPEWLKDRLPESYFERSNYRAARKSEIDEDPVLGFQYAPRLNAVIRHGDIRYGLVTDARGFANLDESLYEAADIVVAGDSFTMGSGVELIESWPQHLARLTGMRVLNLGTAGWDIYQYPRVIAKYGIGAAPKAFVVTLTTSNDLSPRFYDYEDYRAAHPDTAGYRDFKRRTAVRYPADNYLLLTGQLAMVMAPFTTASAVYVYNKVTHLESVCNFRLNGKTLGFMFGASQWRRTRREDNQTRLAYFDRVVRDLTAIAQMAKRIGAEAYFAYVPGPEEIYVPLLGMAEGRDACAQSLYERHTSGEFDFERVSRVYEKAIQGDRRSFLNLTEPLRQKAVTGEQLVWVHDFHPNKLGHMRIAEAIAALAGFGRKT